MDGLYLACFALGFSTGDFHDPITKVLLTVLAFYVLALSIPETVVQSMLESIGDLFAPRILILQSKQRQHHH